MGEGWGEGDIGATPPLPHPYTRKGYAGGYPAATQRPFRSPTRGEGLYVLNRVP